MFDVEYQSLYNLVIANQFFKKIFSNVLLFQKMVDIEEKMEETILKKEIKSEVCILVNFIISKSE